VLSSEPGYDRHVTDYYPIRSQKHYSRADRDIYQIARAGAGAGDRHMVTMSYKNQELPDDWEHRVYELVGYDKDKMEEDEAFAWWKVETEKRLRGR